MAQIPISPDVAELVDDFAEGVQNRSLLLDKFVFHKKWGLGELGSPDAHRWSLLRISDGGESELHREAQRRREQAGGRNVQPHNAERLRAEADLAQRLARTKAEAPDVADLRARHTRRFIGLFQSAYGERAVVRIGTLEGRLAINLADALIQNAGICLDRLFGLPFIPGAALKGICRHTAFEQVRAAKGDEQAETFALFRRIFGTADNDFGKKGALHDFDRLMDRQTPKDLKGAVSFLPAWPVNAAKVVVDLTNVHYPDYYRTGQERDLANEKPLPNPFPAVETGAQFAFCIVLNGQDNDQALIEKAAEWLEEALTVRGVGAKTSAGYGWFSIDREALDRLLEEEREEAESAAKAAEEERLAAEAKEANEKRLAELPPEERACEAFEQLHDDEFAGLAASLSDRTEEEQKGYLMALTRPEKGGLWKAWKKTKKPKAQKRVEALRELAGSHGIELP